MSLQQQIREYIDRARLTALLHPFTRQRGWLQVPPPAVSRETGPAYPPAASLSMGYCGGR